MHADQTHHLGAPSKLDSGQMVRFTTANVFSVRSTDVDHPFYLSGHMEGCERVLLSDSDPGSDADPVLHPEAAFFCPGDPDYVNVIPPPQWLNSYLFLADPTYATTHLNFVRQKIDGAFQDVELDCVGALSGWQPVGKNGVPPVIVK